MACGTWTAAARRDCCKPDHFARRGGRPVDFSQDHYLPFARRFAEAIRAVQPGAAIFVESAPQQPPPRWRDPGLVHAPHWYDGFVLFLKRYSRWVAVDSRSRKLVFTPWRIRRSFADQLKALRDEAAELGGAPTLLGEFGIAFDLAGGRAFRDGDFRDQVEAMDRTLRALDDALLSGTLWNYTADNSNARGDLWNGEDLSIFSRDQQRDPQDLHSGGRALEAVVRPYARAVAGEPLRMHFDRRRRVFEFGFRHDPGHLGADRDLRPRLPVSARLPGDGLRRLLRSDPGGADPRLPPRRGEGDPHAADPSASVETALGQRRGAREARGEAGGRVTPRWKPSRTLPRSMAPPYPSGWRWARTTTTSSAARERVRPRA